MATETKPLTAAELAEARHRAEGLRVLFGDKIPAGPAIDRERLLATVEARDAGLRDIRADLTDLIARSMTGEGVGPWALTSLRQRIDALLGGE